MTNSLSYTLLFSEIAITPITLLLTYFPTLCQTLGTNSPQNCLFEESGDIVTHYIAVLAQNSSLVQQTNEKWYYAIQGLFQKL